MQWVSACAAGRFAADQADSTELTKSERRGFRGGAELAAGEL